MSSKPKQHKAKSDPKAKSTPKGAWKYRSKGEGHNLKPRQDGHVGRQYKLPNQKEVLVLWENFRKKDCMEQKKVISKALRLVDAYFVKALSKPDLSRVLQACLKHGTAEHRKQMLEKVQDDLVELCKNNSGRHFVVKLFKYGCKATREKITSMLYPYSSMFAKHTNAIRVLDFVFSAGNKAIQRKFILMMFNKVPSMAFKIEEDGTQDAEALWAQDPVMQKAAVDKLWDTVDTCVTRGLFDYLILHRSMEILLRNAPYKRNKFIVDQCIQGFVHMCNTQSGAAVCCKSMAYLDQKQRHQVLLTFKRSVADMCQGRYAYLFVCKMMDCVDDVAAVSAILIPEIQNGLEDIIVSASGNKVLYYLLTPDDDKKRKMLQTHSDYLWQRDKSNKGPTQIEVWDYDEQKNRITQLIPECIDPPGEKHDIIISRLLATICQLLLPETNDQPFETSEAKRYYECFESRRVITALLDFCVKSGPPAEYKKCKNVITTLQPQLQLVEKYLQATHVVYLTKEERQAQQQTDEMRTLPKHVQAIEKEPEDDFDFEAAVEEAEADDNVRTVKQIVKKRKLGATNENADKTPVKKRKVVVRKKKVATA